MTSDRDGLRLLLLQIRRDPRVRREEHESFANFAGLGPDQIEILNVFDTPSFQSDVLLGFDGLLVGGSSNASVLEAETYGFLPYARALLRHCIDDKIPVFASCFGFQLAVQELGGVITRDRENFEMGTLPIEILPEAAGDPIFGGLSESVLAVSVHQESALVCPSDCVELARTDVCCHAFRVVDAPFWAFQFHPELDRACVEHRLRIYQESYLDDDGHLDEVLASLRETPEANSMVKSFVDSVLLDPGR
jgi:GMP synthase (glutamine-hydrolysing)